MCCHPKNKSFRLLVLISIGLLTYGSFSCYDIPGGLPAPFQLYLTQNSTEKLSLMYSIYSIPNIILPFVGGYLIDHLLGKRFGMLVCVALVFLGNLIVALAATFSSEDAGTTQNFYPFLAAVVGRFVFGTGAETLNTRHEHQTSLSPRNGSSGK